MVLGLYNFITLNFVCVKVYKDYFINFGQQFSGLFGPVLKIKSNSVLGPKSCPVYNSEINEIYVKSLKIEIIRYNVIIRRRKPYTLV